VQGLVEAMASFKPPGAGETSLPQEYRSMLEPRPRRELGLRRGASAGTGRTAFACAVGSICYAGADRPPSPNAWGGARRARSILLRVTRHGSWTRWDRGSG
jgi:hypothetical protein